MRSRSCSIPFLAAVLLASSFGSASAQWIPNGVCAAMAANDQISPEVCPDGAGGVIAVWADARTAPNQYDIYAQRLDGAGFALWAADGIPVCTISGSQIAPSVVSDGAGGAIIAWEDARNGNSDIFAQRVSPTGASLWTAGGIALCTNVGTQSGIEIVSDGLGGAIVMWEDVRDLSSDIYGQRVNAAGTRRWTLDGRQIVATDEEQFAPRLVASGSAGAIVVWFDDRNFEFDLFAQRVDSTGAGLWTANGVVVCDTVGTQQNHSIVSDGANGVIVAWEDFRDELDSFDIFVQRLNTAGARQWNVNGVSLVRDEFDQGVPTITTDGAAGAIVSWLDDRNPSTDIFARRVNSSGVPQWAAGGVAVCTAAGTQQVPRIVSDGAGGAIVNWEDFRLSEFNINLFAQRLNASGSAMWAANGAAITNAGGDQVGSVAIGDGAGGMFVTWEDARSGISSDIYIHRVAASGPTLDVPGTLARDFELLGIHPNPCRSHTAIRFALPVEQSVTAAIYDLGGRRVRELARGMALPAGAHTLAWDATDESGAPVRGGLYWLRLSTPNGWAAAKVTVLR